MIEGGEELSEAMPVTADRKFTCRLGRCCIDVSGVERCPCGEIEIDRGVGVGVMIGWYGHTAPDPQGGLGAGVGEPELHAELEVGAIWLELDLESVYVHVRLGLQDPSA